MERIAADRDIHELHELKEVYFLTEYSQQNAGSSS
jgi:hypothetical protein